MSQLVTHCSVCRALIDEEDLFCANCGAEAPRPEGEQQRPEARLATHSFECNGCGASLSYDASSQTLRCPFCGSSALEEKPEQRTLQPNYVIPFKLDQAAAMEAMRRQLKQGFWRPNDAAQQAVVTEMVDVYVPYWVFEAHVHTYWTADTNQTPAGARGDWFPLFGERYTSYQGVLVGASGALTPRETHDICPFDLSEGVAPDEMDLENVTMEQFAVPRKFARPLAREGLEAMEAAAVARDHVPGRSPQRESQSSLGTTTKRASTISHLDHGLRLQGKAVSLPGQWANGGHHGRAAVLVAEAGHGGWNCRGSNLLFAPIDCADWGR